ncbi:MAG: CBS domain-containing protein [Gemmatales bacterium]|nr:CBS domain-containing protein [Gemmatales bacterium]MDW7993086.1 CBS domain-containing protein [Gemmatales bacterium]
MICPVCGSDNLPGEEVCVSCWQPLTPLDEPQPQDELSEALMHTEVRELRPQKPITVLPTTPVREAIRLLVDYSIGAVLVANEEGHLVGIFSERDLLMRVVGFFEQFDNLPVGWFMTPNPEVVKPDHPVLFAVHKMDAGDYRHLPVVRDQKPLGMISARDILRFVANYV